MKKGYYKIKSLAIGLIVFGLSMAAIGALATNNVKNGIVDINDTLYLVSFVMAVVGMIIGEGFILNAASYDIKDDASLGADE